MRFLVRTVHRWASGVILPGCIAVCLSAAFLLAPVDLRAQKTPNSNLPSGFQATPQFVNGKVVMDDGTQPPNLIPIEMICSGIARTEGHTDNKGNFGVELGHDELVQDATYVGGAVLNPNRPVTSSDPGADPNRPYRECELRANLLGYRSDLISLSTYRPGENSNVGTMMLHKMGSVEGTVVSMTTAAAPRNAAREYERGLDDVKKGKIDDAVESFNKAISFYSDFAAAWFELGKLQVGRQQLLDAQKSFEAAIKAEPRFISPYLQLSQLAFKARNWPSLVEVTDKLLNLDGFDFPQEYYYNGLGNYTLQHMDLAEASLRQTVKLDTQNRFPKAHQFLAAILVKNNDLKGAVEELNTYLKFATPSADTASVRLQLSQLEKIARASTSDGK